MVFVVIVLLLSFPYGHWLASFISLRQLYLLIASSSVASILCTASPPLHLTLYLHNFLTSTGALRVHVIGFSFFLIIRWPNHFNSNFLITSVIHSTATFFLSSFLKFFLSNMPIVYSNLCSFQLPLFSTMSLLHRSSLVFLFCTSLFSAYWTFSYHRYLLKLLSTVSLLFLFSTHLPLHFHLTQPTWSSSI